MMTIEHVPLDVKSNEGLISMFASPAFKTMLKVARAKRDKMLLESAEANQRSIMLQTNEKSFSESLAKEALNWDMFINMATALASQTEVFTTIKVIPTPTT